MKKPWCDFKKIVHEEMIDFVEEQLCAAVIIFRLFFKSPAFIYQLFEMCLLQEPN